jgi:hypothetical protein
MQQAAHQLRDMTPEVLANLNKKFLPLTQNNSGEKYNVK